MATILMIFLTINLSNVVQCKQYLGKFKFTWANYTDWK